MNKKITRTINVTKVKITNLENGEIEKEYIVQGSTSKLKEGKKYAKETGKFSFKVDLEVIQEKREMDIYFFIKNSTIVNEEF